MFLSLSLSFGVSIGNGVKSLSFKPKMGHKTNSRQSDDHRPITKRKADLGFTIKMTNLNLFFPVFEISTQSDGWTHTGPHSGPRQRTPDVIEVPKFATAQVCTAKSERLQNLRHPDNVDQGPRKWRQCQHARRMPTFGTWISLIEVPENGDGASVQDASRWVWWPASILTFFSTKRNDISGHYKPAPFSSLIQSYSPIPTISPAQKKTPGEELKAKAFASPPPQKLP